ncbi:MAG: alkaline phosphatase, partial [Planctomycetes bacterium]|nr:alkaline phosphatase [Planctomycetota bacterium]
MYCETLSRTTRRAILAAAVFALACAGLAAADPVILPINRAKFLLGQRFDFLVEAREGAEAIRVTVNGRPADEFFGKTGTLKTVDGVTSYRIDDVRFREPGPGEGTATASAGGTDKTATVTYEVAAEKAPRQAKNVILFIGDGMGLPVRDMARILSKGIVEGKYNDVLEMEKLTNTAIITTSGYDSLGTDSANSASAYATGHKSVVNAMG